MTNEAVVSEIREGVAWLYLNKPDDLNAIGKDLLEALTKALHEAEENQAVRVAVLTGKGRAFCAGANLKELLEYVENPQMEDSLFDKSEQLFGALERFKKPLIAAINGVTVAGGLEIAMTCDFMIASDQAQIGDGHANFGVIPGAGGAVKLPRKIGMNHAKYLLFTGEIMSAKKMEQYGLVEEVVAHENLETRVQEIALKIAKKSPLVLKTMKQLANDGMEQPLEIALKQELIALKVHTQSYDLSEGLRAFSEKRKPDFKGY